MPSVASYAALVPFSLAPASVAIAVCCGLLSLLLPRARSRHALQAASIVEMLALVSWGLSPASRCEPRCRPAEDLLSTLVLSGGPVAVLVLCLVAAFLIDTKAPGP